MPDSWQMHDWNVGLGPWHMVIPLIFWIGLIAGVVYLIQRLGSNGGKAAPEGRALEMLNERYAKGEIDREEFVRRRQDIKGA
jgi:putative membrane protein